MFKHLRNKCPYGQVTDHSELKCPDCDIKGKSLKAGEYRHPGLYVSSWELLLVSVICYDERGMLVNALDSADHNKSRSKTSGWFVLKVGCYWQCS